MRKKKTTSKLPVLLLSMVLLTYSTVLQFSIPAVVLCFGEDGHIAFEQSDDKFRCIDGGEGIDLRAERCNSLSRQDKHCDDIPLISLIITLFPGKGSYSACFKLFAIDLNSNIVDVFSCDHRNINNISPPVYPAMKIVQSSILLI